jgi:hypothetical protein
MCAIDDGVNKEECHEQEFGAEYREREPEDPYREQEFLEGFEDDKSNSTL